MEAWKPVVGYEGLYEVSDQGRVKRVKTTTSTRAGRLIGGINNHGYAMVTLCKNGRLEYMAIHRAVMRAFVGPCAIGTQVDHVNGVKTDNRLSNLEYVSPSENTRRSYALGFSRGKRGQENSRAKLSNRKAKSLKLKCVADKSRGSLGRLAKKYNVSPSLVCAIRNGRAWQWM